MNNVGFSKTQVQTAAEQTARGNDFRLGTRMFFDDPSLGTQEFIWGRANGAITARGYACVERTAFDFSMITVTLTTPGTAGPGARVAVAQAALADNENGWFQIYGKGPLRTLASAAIGTRLNSTGTAGCLDDDGTAGSEQILGVQLGTATGGVEATNEDALFSYPVVGVTL